MGDGSTKEVDVYPNELYEITHFSESHGSYIKIKGLVKVIGEISLAYLYFTGLEDMSCPRQSNTNLKTMCQSVEMKVGHAFYTTISDITEITEEEDTTCTCPQPPKIPKEVTKVAILGISAETIRSIVVRLRFYDDPSDCCDITEAVPVDMKVGNRYNVSYLDHRDHSVYEVLGKLVAINIKENFGDEPLQHGFIRPEANGCCHNAVEQIGLNNMTYCYNNEHFMSLPKDCPDDISFVFDTSMSGEATLDVVKLKDIRGCRLVDDEGDDFLIEDDTEYDEQPKDPVCGGCHSFNCCDHHYGCHSHCPPQEEKPPIHHPGGCHHPNPGHDLPGHGHTPPPSGDLDKVFWDDYKRYSLDVASGKFTGTFYEWIAQKFPPKHPAPPPPPYKPEPPKKIETDGYYMTINHGSVTITDKENGDIVTMMPLEDIMKDYMEKLDQ